MTVAQGADKLTIMATLAAAIIGGVFGFSGSLLVFFSSQGSIEQAYGQHVEDVRREYYADFLADANKIQTSLGFSSRRAIPTGKTLNVADCNANDLFGAQEASVNRVYLLAPETVAKPASKLSQALTDWFNTLCLPGLSYTRGEEEYALDAINSARTQFIDAARETVAK
jgi:hypothetical protein